MAGADEKTTPVAAEVKQQQAASNGDAAPNGDVAANGDASRPKNRQNRPRKNKGRGQDGKTAAVEQEFINFINKLRSMNVGTPVAYQINNYPQGVECTFRVGVEEGKFTSDFTAPVKKEKKPLKDLTPEQQAKIEARRERRREIRMKRNAEMKAARLAAKEAKAGEEQPKEVVAAAEPASPAAPAAASPAK